MSIRASLLMCVFCIYFYVNVRFHSVYLLHISVDWICPRVHRDMYMYIIYTCRVCVWPSVDNDNTRLSNLMKKYEVDKTLNPPASFGIPDKNLLGKLAELSQGSAVSSHESYTETGISF